MGERGPKPKIVENLPPEQRRELDEAIVDGRETKRDLYERFKGRCDCSYRKFCNYAYRLETRAKNRYFGELLTKVFGRLPDTEIDTRARGVVMAMLNNIAVDVMHDHETNPRHLRDVVKAFDTLRRGSIAESDASRRDLEWEVVRAAGVAEAAAQIKESLAREITGDPALRSRLEDAVDGIQDRLDVPAKQVVTKQIIDRVARRHGLRAEAFEAINEVFGLDAPGPAERPSEAETRQSLRDIYNMPEEGNS